MPAPGVELTPTQFRDFYRELALVKSKLDVIHSDLKQACGPNNRLVEQTEEASNAIRLLEWELQKSEK